MLITQAENGYVLRLYNEGMAAETHVFEGEEVEATLSLLQFISSELSPGSRYDANRVYVVGLPGDKYEGELTEDQKRSLDFLRSLC
jgi:hypothetical protein